MRYSLILPTPGPASPEQVLDFAQAADDLGYHGVYMNSRVARPVKGVSPHPYMAEGKWPWPPQVNWPDSFVVFGAIAARTKRLRFGPMVVPVIVTHPLTLAKQAATLDAYSNGRLDLGLGAGWLLEEAQALGRPTDRRWLRLEETIEILRLAWNQDTFSYAGQCYEFNELGQHPHPVQAQLPLWIGGHGQRALEIAARSGAGVVLWGGYPPVKVAEYVRRIRALSDSVPVATLIDSQTPLDELDELLAAMERSGADMVMLSRLPVTDNLHMRVIKEFAARFLPG